MCAGRGWEAGKLERANGHAASASPQRPAKLSLRACPGASSRLPTAPGVHHEVPAHVPAVPACCASQASLQGEFDRAAELCPLLQRVRAVSPQSLGDELGAPTDALPCAHPPPPLPPVPCSWHCPAVPASAWPSAWPARVKQWPTSWACTAACTGCSAQVGMLIAGRIAPWPVDSCRSMPAAAPLTKACPSHSLAAPPHARRLPAAGRRAAAGPAEAGSGRER